MPLARVLHTGQKTQGGTRGGELMGLYAGFDQEAGIVAGVDDFHFAGLGMQPQEDGRNVAAARLFAFEVELAVDALVNEGGRP